MNNPIIVALDAPGAAEAWRLVYQLGDAVRSYKVGMELYAAEGPAVVRELLARGAQVFPDLKFYGIPETVKRATAQVAQLGVTVLTSFDESDLADLGYPCKVEDPVTPGVRSAGAIGRRITRAAEPRAEALRILEEIQA